MANLVELFDNIVQMQNLNGVPLAAGKLYVYALGRTRLMDSWSDVDGESLNPNPIILDDAGQAHVYVSDDFDYTLVVCDQYNNEIFSLDKYLYSKGSHSHADVAIAPSESIAVSSYHVGETTVYVPYLTGQLGKVYEGIDPIVVNNQVDKISANHVPLGVQDPLYFVQDDEEGCIIGCSAQTEIPSALSSKWDEASDVVIANSAQWAEGTTYEAGSYVDIDGNTINVTGLQPAGNYQSAGDYVVHDELSSYATQDWVNEQGFLTAHQDISNKLDTTAFSTVSGDFLTAHQSLDGLMSADLLEISDNKITGYNGTAFAGQGGVTGDYELVAGSGVELVDDPDAHTTTINVTAQGGNPGVEQAVIDNSANWNEVSAKVDTSATIPVISSFYKFVTATDYIGAVADTSGNLYQIVSRTGDPQSAWVVEYKNDAISKRVYWGNYSTTWPVSSNMVISPHYLQFADAFNVSPGWFNVSGVITANTTGLVANGLSANDKGFSAGGITAGNNTYFCIKSPTESFSAGGGGGFTFTSVNTGFGTAQLTTAYGNQIVQMYSPKFEVRNISGAGFSIEASGAKGYDHNGNVTWDTSVVPPANNLIGYADTKASTGDLYGNIVLTVVGKSYQGSLSAIPYTIINADGLTATYGATANTPNIILNPNGITAQSLIGNSAKAQFGIYANGVKFDTSAGTWSLTASVQKREIECDTATSAITAIAGSAIGGGGGGVPQSAFDELKQSYDALSALFAQYSGQWLLPNEGEE